MKFTLDFLYLFFHGLWLIAPLLLFFALLIFTLGQWVGRVEKWGRFDAFYWSFITAFTVGYGDITPLSNSARILAIVITFCGLMFTGLIVATAVTTANMAFTKNVGAFPVLS